MWFLLSTKVRTWLALAVALPLARALTHRVAAAATRKNPDAAATKLLRRADTALIKMGSKTARREQAAHH